MSHTFDPQMPLPSGPVVLEASAGTGKTHSIAHLAERYISESSTAFPDGLPIQNLLVLTFTTKAAGELASRIYDRLRTALRSHPSGSDAYLRLERAIEHFDQATIGTIHSFCDAQLRGLGVLGDWDHATHLHGSGKNVMDQVIQDFYFSDPQIARRPYDSIQRFGYAVLNSDLPLVPAGCDVAAAGEKLRAQFERRKAQHHMATFNDLQARLHRLVVEQPAVGAALRERYSVVLIDEFQDTDPKQWAIMKTVFADHGWPLIMIGDPKQSIYSFRNADLLCYLEAAEGNTTYDLAKNWRSDGPLVDAVTQLFKSVTMGDSFITVKPVKKEYFCRMTMGGDPVVPLRIRRAPRSATTATINADIVHQINDVLEHGVILDPEKKTSAPVVASDIAVLVRSHQRGESVVKALRAANIPAVMMANGSVLSQPAGKEWQLVLRAMVELDRADVIQAAMTQLLGYDVRRLLDDGGAALTEITIRLQQARDLLTMGSRASWTSYVLDQFDTLTRLAQPSTEQHLMELTQVAQFLEGSQASTVEEVWEEFLTEATESVNENNPVQLATSQPVVQVLTLHSAKGLQYPIVLLPDISGSIYSTRLTSVVEDGSRKLNVLDGEALDPTVVQEMITQQRDEELRLLYVGFTRAKHHVIAWHHWQTKRSPQAAFTALLARDPDEPLRSSYSDLPAQIPKHLTDSGITYEEVTASASSPTRGGVTGSQPEPLHGQPVLGQWTRNIDATWARTSYSALTADQPHASSISDEREIDELLDTDEASQHSPSPMADLPAGAAFGTVIHQLFESINWAPDVLRAQARRLSTEWAPMMGLDQEHTGQLAHALELACTTPLGGLADGASLSDLPITSRLAELSFDLPLGESGSSSTVRCLAEAMAHYLPADDPLAEYPQQLMATDASDKLLRGILTGSIDAVLRTPSGSYLVVDYKTNRFPSATPLTVGHYAGRPMAQAMMHAHYPLQALLYCAALHRYLRWRLPDYDPHQHLGGVGYLFVRGMAGPTTPTLDGMTCGVFEWHPSVELVMTASEVLGGRHA